MPNVTRSALVPYSAAQLYQLVAQVDDYEQFIPGCSASSLSGDSNPRAGHLDIGLAGFNVVLNTAVTLEPEHRIETRLVDGPAKQFVGTWRFNALAEDACKVEFILQYELGLKGLALKPFINEIASTMVSAFTDRAKEVYG